MHRAGVPKMHAKAIPPYAKDVHVPAPPLRIGIPQHLVQQHHRDGRSGIELVFGQLDRIAHRARRCRLPK